MQILWLEYFSIPIFNTALLRAKKFVDDYKSGNQRGNDNFLLYAFMYAQVAHVQPCYSRSNLLISWRRTFVVFQLEIPRKKRYVVSGEGKRMV